MKRFLLTLTICALLSSVTAAEDAFLAGTDNGLYRITGTSSRLLWHAREVRKILHDGTRWIILSLDGIHVSTNLQSFTPITNGIPVKVVKLPEEGTKKFVREVQELKDLEIHPSKPEILVTATKDAVYLSRNGGESWESLGRSAQTAGVKAVSVLDLPDSTGEMRLTVFMSHPIYGISWKYADQPKSAWNDLNDGLYCVPSIRWPDEVADIVTSYNGSTTEVFVSNTFKPVLYRLDWDNKKFESLWQGAAPLDTVEGLAPGKHSVVFASPSKIRELPLAVPAAETAANSAEPVEIRDWYPLLGKLPGIVLSAWIPEQLSGNRGALSLSELWLLSPSRTQAPHTAEARGKAGNYIPVYQITTPEGLKKHLEILKKNNLNMLVVDMKDDYGFIRYDSKDPLVRSLGTFSWGVNLDELVTAAKAQGVYLIARIVVFKDRGLARQANGKFAVWDKTENKPWQGYRLVREQKEVTNTTDQADQAESTFVRQYYDEHWVDPYSEEVWKYNVAISRELIERGFDEIQFDYIRFPTDGKNLSDAQFRWQDTGMDRESALMSFLSYARKNINAPISIDIYGANGWYRTGARTGQDVELLARYVDVICPMFYPSHFEQQFLAHEPAIDRPYRIFLHGSYRNAIIARNHIAIRPWVQAFYLNVSYDRKFYNQDYVQRQVFGARDALNQGYTYWNNSGRYEDLRPDVDLTAPYPWQPPAETPAGRLPFFGEDSGALR